MRLIDADALKQTMKDLVVEGGHKYWRAGAQTMIDKIMPKVIDDEPTVEAELVKHGQWIITEKDKLMPTGKIAVSEGYILHKTSLDEPFTLQSAKIIQIKEHRTVKRPYCSICGNYGDDEYDRTPYCPYCGALMGGEIKNET